jgi:hypothetical protein
MSHDEAHAAARVAVREALRPRHDGVPRSAGDSRFGRVDCPACGRARGVRFGYAGRTGVLWGRCDNEGCVDFRDEGKRRAA